MSCTIRFNHNGWEVMTDRWTAGTDNEKRTQVRYTWHGGDCHDTVADLKVSFNAFADYVDSCGRANRVADLRDEKLAGIEQHYKKGQAALGR